MRASRDDDVDAMLAIYLHHIRHGVDPSESTKSRRRNSRTSSIGARTCRSIELPHLVADQAGTVVGYAYAVPFRKRPAYRYAVKHSIYVHHEHLHSGIGRLLLPALIDACAASGYRQMIGYIDAVNIPSISIARSLRVPAGRLFTVDRLQVRRMDGFDDNAAFPRAGCHNQAGHVAVIAVIFD